MRHTKTQKGMGIVTIGSNNRVSRLQQQVRMRVFLSNINKLKMIINSKLGIIRMSILKTNPHNNNSTAMMTTTTRMTTNM